jgi:peptide-methionine (S)-S-oxide reductase
MKFYKGAVMNLRLATLILATGLILISMNAPASDVYRPSAQPHFEKATFAGGCFWCMEAEFKGLDGVISVTSGYTGGNKINPTYEEVSSGSTGHAESVEITFNPTKISYAKLLDVFWHNIDPTVKDRQFCDIGNQYRTAIFYHDGEQKRLAELSRNNLISTGRIKPTVYTEIVPAGVFYQAEEYHQDYYKKNPLRYKFYRYNCGRDKRLKEIWGKE